MRSAETLHQGPAWRGRSAGTRARILSSPSCVVLAGGHCCRNRAASSRRISVGHAFPWDAYLGGHLFSGSGSPILVAYRPVFTECDKVASMDHGLVLVSCNLALRHSFRIPRVL